MNNFTSISCKGLLILFFLVTASFVSKAQKADSIWFNSKWQKTLNSEEYYYLRTIQPIDNRFEVKDHYRNGTVQMAGFFSTLNPDIKDGEFSYFNEQGALIAKNIWVKNMVAETINYDANGKQTQHVIKKEYLATLSADEKQQKYGIRDIEKQPVFPGGDDLLPSFLIKNIIYPSKALQKKLQGKVILAASIDEKGNLVNIRVRQSAHPLLDEEALRVAKLLPKKKWTPAQDKGKNIPADFIFPISFTL